MLFYGSLEYFIENGEEDTGFYSIPQGMWYAVQTLTSLGYGDFSPTTILGKLVGSACAVSGVLVMALPIPIVVENFGAYYMEQKKRAVIAAKKQELESARSTELASGKFEMEQLLKILQAKPGPFKQKPPSPVSK